MPGRFVLRTLVMAGLTAMACAGWAQSAKPEAKHHPGQAAKPVAAAPAAPVESAPPQPKWPVNESPAEPSVTWNSQGLQIKANNSTLSQILHQVSTETGAKIDGLGKDERVFGDYGPGQAKDVLAQLLHGSGYDYIMVGDEGAGMPRTVILSPRQDHPTPSLNPPPNQAQNDDVTVEPDTSDDADQQPPQTFQPPPQQQQPPVNPQGPMTPQQRMQLMQQQRLQQMQQMQRQYEQQQQQQPQ